MYFREDQADIRLTVKDADGNIPAGLSQLSALSWKTIEGGDLSSSTEKTRPGGMGSEVDIGGEASRSDITLTTQLTDVTAGYVAALDALVGIGAAKASVTLLNKKKHASGSALGPWTGTLKGVNPPGFGGGSGATMLTVVIGADEVAAAGA